jgi:succinylglutamate desuccinylase
MENASKALLIAGGMLLAILIATMLIFLNTNVKSMKKAESEKEAQEQLVAFNREYEAYNKKIMYGTDVITVVNKAIQNNKTMDLTDDVTKAYYVNIGIKLISDIKTEVDTTTTYPDKTTKTETTNKVEMASCGLTAGSIHHLGAEESGGRLKMDNTIIDFFNSPKNNTITEVNNKDTVVTTITYNPLNVFKKTIFTCSDVTYDNRTGRINSMTFEEVQEKTS